MLTFYLHSVQPMYFLFLLRLPLWSMGCLEEYCLVSKCMGEFSVIFLLFISSFILLWSEKPHKLSSCKFVGVCYFIFHFWPRLWLFLVFVLLEFEEKVDCAVIGWCGLYNLTRSYWLMVLRSSIFLINFFNFIICWQRSVEVSNYNSGLVYFFFLFYHFLLCCYLLVISRYFNYIRMCSTRLSWLKIKFWLL